MKNLFLYQIINANEEKETSVLYETMYPYLKSLYTYYKDYFCSEPLLMVTSVTNATQYCKIVNSNELYEAICEYLNVSYINTDEERSEEEEEIYSEYETICFNSILLRDAIK